MLNFALDFSATSRLSSAAGLPLAVNLVPHPWDVSQWSKLFAVVSGPLGLNAVQGYPGYAIASDGAYFHRAIYLQHSGTTGNTYTVTLLVRAGTSGNMRMWVRNLDTNSESNFSGPLASLSGTDGGLTIVENTVLADGLTHRILANYTQTADGTLEFAIGPFSSTVGEDVIIVGAQVEEGLVAHPFNGG